MGRKQKKSTRRVDLATIFLNGLVNLLVGLLLLLAGKLMD